ncbi:uncharacterized protein CXorf65-like [Pomacea canaliculata]|uniref:uncharacterized protein CXorf65-like n=1 Tax=Pomacea canaliculata TaxID=400727 RepID=UPI000D734B91|nr:uncharacterized protein CXorf65-like [Pomacea canaliculata]
MFIIVKYGQNETLLCNPSCAVINLLTSIKRRTGFGNTNLILDLSDETGLIKELDIHKTEYATNYLASHATYILVQKDVTPEVDSSDSRSTTPTVQQYTYKPLLERSTDLFPNFRLHVAEVEKIRPKRTGSKSPSPAGRLLSKPKKILNKPAMKKTK